ncbi:antiterminator Q family protein [Psychrobacter sp. I-STPA6b]|uniref:antiterminator Q family protein n=1 Tax=Psychrobacter sp. I-STPA6b TaxID=2585718 RepID=UPI001D0C9AE4|nr:antiterminator Q family protein [Psychrobacter sp. I-STPA6b]
MNITTDDLYEFGKWARDHKDNLCAKSAWELIMQGNVATDNTDISYNISDSKADKIDKAVCALCNYSPALGSVFVQHYVHGLNYRNLAEIHKCSKSKIGIQLSKAGGFVIGRATAIE